MTNTEAVALLAERFPTGLIHPDSDIPIVLPGVTDSAIPEDMAAHFAAEAGMPSGNSAQLVAEAAVHTLESEGFVIMRETELAALRQQAADAPDGRRVIKVHCQCDVGKVDPLLTVTVGKSDEVVIPGDILLRSLLARDPECPGHGA